MINLDLPNLPAAHPLSNMVETKIRRQRGAAGAPNPYPFFWDASFYGLDRVELFQTASSEVQQSVLAMISGFVLNRLCYIEQVGMMYAAQLALLARTVEEQQMYVSIAADEAAHLHGLRKFQPAIPQQDWKMDQLLCALTSLAQHGDRPSVQLVIQVVAEGYGIINYSQLRDVCRSPELAALFSAILKDEANHHGSGVVLLREDTLDTRSVQLCRDHVYAFCRALEHGPGELQLMEAVFGSLDLQQKRRIWDELGIENTNARILSELRHLLLKVPSAAEVVARLDDDGCFRGRRFDEVVAQ